MLLRLDWGRNGLYIGVGVVHHGARDLGSAGRRCFTQRIMFSLF